MFGPPSSIIIEKGQEDEPSALSQTSWLVQTAFYRTIFRKNNLKESGKEGRTRFTGSIPPHNKKKSKKKRAA